MVCVVGMGKNETFGDENKSFLEKYAKSDEGVCRQLFLKKVSRIKE